MLQKIVNIQKKVKYELSYSHLTFLFILGTIFINFRCFVSICYPQIHNTVTKILDSSLNSNKNTLKIIKNVLNKVLAFDILNMCRITLIYVKLGLIYYE